MHLRRGLLALLGPVAPGDELAPGLRLIDASAELGLRLTLLVDGARELDIELSPLTLGLRHAARTPRLGLAYRCPAGEPVDPLLGRRICERLAAALAPREAHLFAVLDAPDPRPNEASTCTERQDPGDLPETSSSPRVREVRADRLLELAGPPGARFYSLSPYVGCLIGCRFCYAQSRLDPLRALRRLPQAPWGSYVDVRVDAPERLAAELAALPPRPIKLCPIVSDPYQAVERRYRLTRRCLEVLAAAPTPPPVLVLTRSDLILRDLPVLAALPRAFVGASIPTLDDEVRAHFEPRAAPIPARLAALRAFRAAGVRRCAVVQPLLPGPIDALADALAEHVDSVSLGVLDGVQGAARDFADPRHAHAADPQWQQRQALALRDALLARRVPVWTGELPPDLLP